MAEAFAGRAALVTGASSGIGQAVARELAREGAAVALLARRREALATLADEIEGAGGRAVVCAADVRDPAALAGAVEQAASELGRLDVVVCAAAVSTAGSIRQVTDEALETAVQTKLLGYVRCCREAAPHLPRGGVVVLVVGGAGKAPNAHNVVNALSNAALLAFTQAFAEEMAPLGVRVVAVNPGPVATPVFDRVVANLAQREGIDQAAAREKLEQQQPLGRVPTAEDVASLVAYLASDAASLISGTAVDFGGRGRAL